jgi:signal transduction histidine kinase
MRTHSSGRDCEAQGRRHSRGHDGSGDALAGADGELEAALRQLTQDQMLVNQALVEKILAYEQVEAALRASEQKLHDLLAHQVANREAERKRISGEIHDSLAQNLLALRIDIVMLYQHTATRQGRLHEWVTAALDNVDTTLRTVKQLMGELRPSGLDLDLPATLELEVRKFTRASGIACQLDCGGALDSLPLDEETALTVCRVLQECLNNVFRHSLASRVTVRLEATDVLLTMTVEDNGIGFDTAAPARSNSFGLAGLRQRLSVHGGALAVKSNRTQGTAVTMRLPLASHPMGCSSAP